MNPLRYRTLDHHPSPHPLTIDAVQYDGSSASRVAIYEWLLGQPWLETIAKGHRHDPGNPDAGHDYHAVRKHPFTYGALYVGTLSGPTRVHEGEWVFRDSDLTHVHGVLSHRELIENWELSEG